MTTIPRFQINLDYVAQSQELYPSIKPSLLFDFEKSKSSDPRLVVSRSGVSTRFGKSGYIESVQPNMPRVNFDPSTKSCLGLLAEESRTNVVRNASLGSYTSLGTSVGPDGNNAYRSIPVGSVSFAGVGEFANQSIALSTTVGQTTDYSFSGYFSPHGPLQYRPLIVIGAIGASLTTLYALIVFNPTTGTFLDKSLNSGWSELVAPRATLHPCGMYYVTWTVRFTQQASLYTSIRHYLQILNENSSQTYTADGLSGFNLACMQFEQGNCVTSYIPTTTASVTRSEDNIRCPISTWFNPAEGTLFVDFAFSDDIISKRVASIDLDFDNRISIMGSNSNATSGPYAEVRTAANSVAVLVNGGAVANARFIAICTYKENDFKFSSLGRTTATESLGTVPTGLTNLYIGSLSNTGHLNSHIRKLAYYPKALNQIEIEAMSSI